MTGPTYAQLRVLRIIAEARGGAPSMREVAREIGASSTNAVETHYVALTRKGLLDRDPLKWRAVRVTDAGLAALGIKVCRHCGGSGRTS